LKQCLGEDVYNERLHQAWIKVYSRLLEVMIPIALSLEMRKTTFTISSTKMTFARVAERNKSPQKQTNNISKLNIKNMERRDSNTNNHDNLSMSKYSKTSTIRFPGFNDLKMNLASMSRRTVDYNNFNQDRLISMSEKVSSRTIENTTQSNLSHEQISVKN
jgi:hypothetical protein